MNKATFLRKLNGWRGSAKLYKLSEPVEYYHLGEHRIKRLTDYVIVSATVAPFSGAETYIFPANNDGAAINMLELKGSYRGDLDHARALRNAGFEVDERNEHLSSNPNG